MSQFQAAHTSAIPFLSHSADNVSCSKERNVVFSGRRRLATSPSSKSLNIWRRLPRPMLSGLRWDTSVRSSRISFTNGSNAKATGALQSIMRACQGTSAFYGKRLRPITQIGVCKYRRQRSALSGFYVLYFKGSFTYYSQIHSVVFARGNPTVTIIILFRSLQVCAVRRKLPRPILSPWTPKRLITPRYR